MASRVALIESIGTSTVPYSLAKNWKVEVKKRGTEELATIYAEETGGSTLGNPLFTGPTGRIGEKENFGWVEVGSYDLWVWPPKKDSDETVEPQILPIDPSKGDVAADVEGKADLDPETDKLVESQLPVSVASVSEIFEILGPEPSGGNDAAVLQAFLNEASASIAASTYSQVVVQLARSATYLLEAGLYKPWNVSLAMGDRTILKATGAFPAEGIVLQDSPPTTVAVASNGADVTTLATLNVAGVPKGSYPSKGQVRAKVSSTVTAIFNYTGLTEEAGQITAFTGCTLANTATGTLATAGKVSALSYNGALPAGIIDSNGLAKTGLWLHYFAHFDIGCTVRNSTQDEVILGDTAAVSAAFGATIDASLLVDRTVGSVPAESHRCLYISVACTDGVCKPTELKGQQIGIQCDGADWKFETAHPWSNGMVTCLYDNGLYNHWINCIADTPTTYGLLLGTSQNYGYFDGFLLYNNASYGADNVVVGVHTLGEEQQNIFVHPKMIGANGTHRIASDYTGNRKRTSWVGAMYENVAAVNIGLSFLSAQPVAGRHALTLQGDTEGQNNLLIGYNSGQVAKLIIVDPSGRIGLYNPQTSVAGTTAGEVIHSMPFMGGTYKKFLVYLNGYKNASATAQEVTIPFAFLKAPLIASQPEAFGASATTTKLKLPKEMAAAVTGWVVLEGY